MTPPFVYLASQSPRRLQLLTGWGIRCELLLPTPDEDAEALETVHPGEAPADYVVRVTANKAQAAWARWHRLGRPPAPIVVADTTVALGHRIMGKPADAQDALAMLNQLNGLTHQVYTAVAVVTPAGEVLPALSESLVTFDACRPDQLARYVASGEPMGKAGAYGVQGLAGTLIARIEGSYTGIMGLPAFETAQLLRQVGFALP